MRDVQYQAALWDARREIDALRAERYGLRAALGTAVDDLRLAATRFNWEHLSEYMGAAATDAQAALDATEPAT